jgi:hypothetical protein
MTSNETRRKIGDMIAEGKTKLEIFNSLGGSDDIARVVAATPDLETRKKYQKLNMILVGIIFYYAVMKFVFSVTTFVISGAPKYLFPLALLVPAAAIYVACCIKKFYGEFYLAVAMLGLAAFSKGIDLPTDSFEGNGGIISVAVQLPLMAGVVIAFILKKRLCPGLGFMGAKTDAAGKYQL